MLDNGYQANALLPLLPITYFLGEDVTQMARGVVKWFNRLKGFGFIEPDEGGADVFIHYSQIDGDGYRNLFEGDVVVFDLIDARNGPQAQNVRLSHSESPNTHPPTFDSSKSLKPSKRP